jgi:hypothetical protein
MQNKPNFRKAKMNVSCVYTKDYENRTLGERGKNKPNSNPIKANSKPIKANKMQNKPNTNPNKPNFSLTQTPNSHQKIRRYSPVLLISHTTP